MSEKWPAGPPKESGTYFLHTHEDVATVVFWEAHSGTLYRFGRMEHGWPQAICGTVRGFARYEPVAVPRVPPAQG